MSAEFVSYVVDCLAPLGAVTVRRMFGTDGLFLDGKMFALVTDEGRIFVKADVLSRATFTEAGCAPLTYRKIACDGGMRTVALSYYAIPEAALADEDALRRWTQLGLDAARRAE